MHPLAGWICSKVRSRATPSAVRLHLLLLHFGAVPMATSLQDPRSLRYPNLPPQKVFLIGQPLDNRPTPDKNALITPSRAKPRRTSSPSIEAFGRRFPGRCRCTLGLMERFLLTDWRFLRGERSHGETYLDSDYSLRICPVLRRMGGRLANRKVGTAGSSGPCPPSPVQRTENLSFFPKEERT